MLQFFTSKLQEPSRAVPKKKWENTNRDGRIYTFLFSSRGSLVHKWNPSHLLSWIFICFFSSWERWCFSACGAWKPKIHVMILKILLLFLQFEVTWSDKRLLESSNSFKENFFSTGNLKGMISQSFRLLETTVGGLVSRISQFFSDEFPGIGRTRHENTSPTTVIWHLTSACHPKKMQQLQLEYKNKNSSN